MTLEYSVEAYLNLPMFFGGTTNLHIYVEDKEGLHIHEGLLSRLLPKLVRFENIHAANGKGTLAKIYEAHKAKVDVPRLFIADLDLDPLIGKPQITDDRFVYLERYSIENYLVDEQPAAAYVKGRLRHSKQQAKAKLAFETWLAKVGEQWKPLILLFSVIQEANLGIPNTGDKVSHFLKEDDWEVDPEKVREYRVSVEKALAARGADDLDQRLARLEQRLAETCGGQVWRLVPGRQLLACFMRYLRALCKDVPATDFIAVSIELCDLEPLKFLRYHTVAVLERAQGKVVSVKEIREADLGTRPA